jgi:hypothetical protein
MIYEINRKDLMDALSMAVSAGAEHGNMDNEEIVYLIERHLHEHGKLTVLGAY